MVRYVCGFMFNPERTHVALISKLRPKWQFGKLNGVGGHIEENESPYDAMKREFKEEAGVFSDLWNLVVEYSVFDVMQSKPLYIATVYFFRSFGDLNLITSLTDEKVAIYRVDEINSLNVLKKIKFLVPLCLNDDIVIPVKMRGARDN